MIVKEPLRKRKKAKTARLIAEVARDLFQRQGYEATTLEQIADAAEVHKQTVLRYFETKEDLAFAYRNILYQEFMEGLESRTGTVLEYWREFIRDSARRAMVGGAVRQWIQFVDSDERLVAYQLRLNQRHAEALAVAISLEAGTDPARDVFAHCVATLLVAANYDVGRLAIKGEGIAAIGEYCEQVIDLAESLDRKVISVGASRRAVAARKPKSATARKS